MPNHCCDFSIYHLRNSRVIDAVLAFNTLCATNAVKKIIAICSAAVQTTNSIKSAVPIFTKEDCACIVASCGDLASIKIGFFN